MVERTVPGIDKINLLDAASRTRCLWKRRLQEDYSTRSIRYKRHAQFLLQELKKYVATTFLKGDHMLTEVY